MELRSSSEFDPSALRPSHWQPVSGPGPGRRSLRGAGGPAPGPRTVIAAVAADLQLQVVCATWSSFGAPVLGPNWIWITEANEMMSGAGPRAISESGRLGKHNSKNALFNNTFVGLLFSNVYKLCSIFLISVSE